MSQCEKKQFPSPPEDIVKDGIWISHEFLQNRFLPSNNLHQIKREDGSTLDTKFIEDTSYHHQRYVCLTPQNETRTFGITLIILQAKKIDSKNTFFPVEDDKIIFNVAKKILTKQEKKSERNEDQELLRIIRNLEREIPLSQALRHLKICNSTVEEKTLSSPRSNL
jgi:hypothetical protein